MMTRARKFTWGTTGLAIVAISVALALWITSNWQIGSAQPRTALAAPPPSSRGYIDALAGTAVVGGEPAGGASVLELRVKDGQKVKRDDIIAVLSNYPKAEAALRKAEANLAKLKQIHDTVLTGTRLTDIALLEATLKSSIESDKLKTLERKRSGKPPDEKELEANIAARDLEREKANVELAKQTLKNDLAQYELDLATSTAQVDNARIGCDYALVRSPLDGTVVQIISRQGESVSPAGIAKIVDMAQLHVFADVDEQQVARLAPGGKVEVTFRGSPTIYTGTISRVAPTVRRMQRVEPDGASSTDARVVQVEIAFDDPSSIPLVLGREARIVFL
jgi:HlyD family secretion protein